MQEQLQSKHNLYESYLINTLMVSKGCPATTVHTPPNPPDKKYFIGFTDFFSDIFIELLSTATRYSTPNSHHSTTESLYSTQIGDHRLSVLVICAFPVTYQFPGNSENEGVALRFY